METKKTLSLFFIGALFASLVVLPGCTAEEVLIYVMIVVEDWFGGSEEDDYYGRSSDTQPGTKETSSDTDGEGLTDEEEEFYGTDPNNPDTDGDGKTDKEEVDAGTNPLVQDTETPQREEGEKEEVGNRAGGKTYTNKECKFTFTYPGDWKITGEEYYTTLGGVQSDIPTILIEKIGDPNKVITINMKMAFECMDSNIASTTPEAAGSQTIRVVRYYNYQNPSEILPGGCYDAKIQAQDRKGKLRDYGLKVYFQDQGADTKKAFKQIVSSFKATQ